MGSTSDEHRTRIDGHDVAVTSRTGPIHATWALLIDGDEVDRAEVEGDFTLRGRLGDGSEVEAFVQRSLSGPTRVSIRHGGTDVSASKGHVA